MNEDVFSFLLFFELPASLRGAEVLLPPVGRVDWVSPRLGHDSLEDRHFFPHPLVQLLLH